jgi:hypothetical protein
MAFRNESNELLQLLAESMQQQLLCSLPDPAGLVSDGVPLVRKNVMWSPAQSLASAPIDSVDSQPSSNLGSPGSNVVGWDGHGDDFLWSLLDAPAAEVAKPYRNPDGQVCHTECSNCHTKETPLWRRTPDKKHSLCNACGLYLKQYKVHRPLHVHKQRKRHPYAKAERAPEAWSDDAFVFRQVAQKWSIDERRRWLGVLERRLSVLRGMCT